MLRFPGRSITDLPDIPVRVLALIAQQVRIPPAAFVSYGQRLPTIYEHLDEIRAVFGYRNYDWRAMRKLARVLLPQALESDRPLSLVAAALQQLRQDKVIAPASPPSNDWCGACSAWPPAESSALSPDR